MNSADRLLALYLSVINQPNSLRMLEVWLIAFGLEKSQYQSVNEDAVMRCITALRQQIDNVKTWMTAQDIPINLWDRGLSRLRDITSPNMFNTQFNQLAGNINTADTRLSLEISAWVMRNEFEETIPEEQLASLKVKLQELEDSLTEIEMASTLRTFICTQIESIKSALQLYTIQGERPIKEALQKVAGAYAFDAQIVQAEVNSSDKKTKNLYEKFKTTLKDFVEIADNLSKTKDTVTAIGSAAKPLLLDAFKNVLGG